MRRKSLVLLLMTAVVSVGVILFGFIFVSEQVGEVHLTEETLVGSRSAAEGITAGYRADAGDDLHWTASYDFGSGETDSTFQRGEMAKTTVRSVYEDFRFIGWSEAPYTTLVENPLLEGMQDGKLQRFYNHLEEGASGCIKLSDYLEYYPISFRFQFGTKIYNSEDALRGLKIYEDGGASGNASEYDEDVQLYLDLNRFFRIPVIESEYQNYQVSQEGIQVKPNLDKNTDYYQFDPMIVLQEENLMDGETWNHPDFVEGKHLGKDGDYAGKTAEQYNLKNRLLFVVNNRTEKGKPVDMSQIESGYGIYELPVETRATASVRYGKRSTTVPNPKPLSDRLAMVYPLDEDAEYVELSMSPDHRYLAVFFVRDGGLYVEMIDADLWKQQGVFRMFDAAEKLTYTWGEDGSLAVTSFQNRIAVFVRAGNENDGYQILYCGVVPAGFDEAFFDRVTTRKAHSYSRYQWGFDEGLAIACKDGRIAFVQNPLAEDGSSGMREPSLICAVMDEKGILYWGKLHSSVKDSGSDADGKAEEKWIVPTGDENWVKWE